MTTADRIKNRRIELGLTQLEVAKRLGLTSKAAVSKIESQGDDVSLKNVKKFGEALGCSIAYLMGWEDEKEQSDKDDEFLSKEDAEFITLYRQLSDEQKKLVDNMLTVLSSKQ